MSENVIARKRIAVKAGTVLTFDVLRWDEGWDFDCPVCVLRPVVRYSPNGEDAEQMVEEICEDAASDGYIEDDIVENGLVDRQYPLKSLKRRWSMARAGKEFPRLGYTAYRLVVRFSPSTEEPDLDDDGYLDFDIEEQDAE